jgi:hypothetical protein
MADEKIAEVYLAADAIPNLTADAQGHESARNGETNVATGAARWGSPRKRVRVRQ